MSNSKNSYYTISSKDLFNDAEPYLYGEPYPNTGKYLPLPWGKDTEEFTTDDLKIQMPEYNGYSNIKYIDGFKINESIYSYLEFVTTGYSGLANTYPDNVRLEVKDERKD